MDAEATALAGGASRSEAIYAAYDAFYRGDIAADFVAGAQQAGAAITMEDMGNWQVYIEEPVTTNYKGVDVYKLTTWVQGPVMLQALNMLEGVDLQSMGFNSANYLHALYQVLNLSFADRDFYYGDPYFPPAEPVAGLLSKEYAAARLAEVDWEKNDPHVGPGDPYPFQGDVNPFTHLLERWGQSTAPATTDDAGATSLSHAELDEDFYLGTTSIQAADAEGWVVSITPSGGWIPAVIAGGDGDRALAARAEFCARKRRTIPTTCGTRKTPSGDLDPWNGTEGR